MDRKKLNQIFREKSNRTYEYTLITKKSKNANARKEQYKMGDKEKNTTNRKELLHKSQHEIIDYESKQNC